MPSRLLDHNHNAYNHRVLSFKSVVHVVLSVVLSNAAVRCTYHAVHIEMAAVGKVVSTLLVATATCDGTSMISFLGADC